MSIKAEWITEYDMHNDEVYKCPGCEKCYAPVFKIDGKYLCCSCGEEAELDTDMIEYFKPREETKTEMKDCLFGCGGKACVETHFMRNPVTLKWQVMGGVCKNCGIRFMV